MFDNRRTQAGGWPDHLGQLLEWLTNQSGEFYEFHHTLQIKVMNHGVALHR